MGRCPHSNTVGEKESSACARPQWGNALLTCRCSRSIASRLIQPRAAAGMSLLSSYPKAEKEPPNGSPPASVTGRAWRPAPTAIGERGHSGPRFWQGWTKFAGCVEQMLVAREEGGLVPPEAAYRDLQVPAARPEILWKVELATSKFFT